MAEDGKAGQLEPIIHDTYLRLQIQTAGRQLANDPVFLYYSLDAIADAGKGRRGEIESLTTDSIAFPASADGKKNMGNTGCSLRS
jgi:hypothetical protein